MREKIKSKIFDLPELRNRIQVFQDRDSAGKVLVKMMIAYRKSKAIVIGVPAGGVAVAASLAKELQLSLDVAVVSKITLPWNSEAGYGAVAFDGTVKLNQELLSHLNLNEKEIQRGIEKTTQKINHRVKMFRGDQPLPIFSQNTTILVDDGLASGFTLLVAIEALRKAGSQHIILAVPTAHEESIERVIEKVEGIYCPNIRGGWQFAVADAYEYWYDIDEEEVIKILTEFNAESKKN
jgi:predicted phosphoribosyltransferase